jgi:hypothetical protein
MLSFGIKNNFHHGKLQEESGEIGRYSSRAVRIIVDTLLSFYIKGVVRSPTNRGYLKNMINLPIWTFLVLAATVSQGMCAV